MDVDEPVTKVVDGRGNDVTDVQTLPDAPTTRDDMLLILLPKTPRKAHRIIGERQIKELKENGGSGVERLLGKDTIENYNIGYVPREVNGQR